MTPQSAVLEDSLLSYVGGFNMRLFWPSALAAGVLSPACALGAAAPCERTISRGANRGSLQMPGFSAATDPGCFIGSHSFSQLRGIQYLHST